MADGDGSKKLKLVIGITAGVLALCALCCVGGWFLIPKDMRNMVGEGMQMAQQMAAGIQAFDKGFADDFGEDGRWQINGAGQEALLIVGVPGDVELDEATVTDMQDRAWTRYVGAFSGGGIPLTGIAIGRAGARTGGSSSYQGKVTSWSKNVAEVDVLVDRTGLAAPPASEFFESMESLATGNDGVRVNVEVTPGDDEPEVEETRPDGE